MINLTNVIDEWRKAKRQIVKLNQQIADLQAKIEDLESENEELSSHNSELEDEIVELTAENSDLEQENADLKAKNDELGGDDGAKLLEWFDWECLTYHQRERVKRFSEVMRGYVTYEEFYANNIR